MVKKRKFEYKKRSKKDIQRNKQRVEGNGKAHPVRGDVIRFQPKEGENNIRILPPAPSWESYKHYGYITFTHYQVGADQAAYACPTKMANQPCPICEERAATDESDDDYRRQLSASKQVAVYVIDRDKEDEGPKLWLMPATKLDAEILTRSTDKRTGEVLNVDDPDEGFDVTFTKGGTGINTQYSGVDIARNSTPLSDDADQMADWLEYITENPIPEVIQIPEYADLKAVFEGGATKDEEEEEAEEEPAPRASRKPSSRKQEPEPEADDDPEEEEEEEGSEEEESDGPDLDYAELKAMDEDELEDLIAEYDLDCEPEARDVAKALGIEIPKRSASRLRRGK